MNAQNTRNPRLRAWLPYLGWLSTTVLLLLVMLSPHPDAAGFKVGYVDSEAALRSHPKFKTASQAVETYRATRLKELDSFKGRALTDDDKKQLIVKNESIANDVQKKHDELMEPLAEDVEKAIKAVGASSGVEVMLEAAAVRFGGIDMTPAVEAELKKY